MAESSVRQAFRDMLTARSADRVQSMGGVLTRFEKHGKSRASPRTFRFSGGLGAYNYVFHLDLPNAIVSIGPSGPPDPPVWPHISRMN